MPWEIKNVFKLYTHLLHIACNYHFIDYSNQKPSNGFGVKLFVYTKLKA